MIEQTARPAHSKVGPHFLLTRLAGLEAVTWALLLFGMFLKYVTETTELGVRVFGMFHGIVFIAYCLVALMVWVDQKWSAGRLAIALVSAVVPFMTIWFTLHVEARDQAAPLWRLRSEQPTTVPERLLSWVVRNPLTGLAVGLVAVAGLSAVALVVGPPAS